MALRDKLRDRVQPLLEPGEEVQAVIPVQTGRNPMAIVLVGPFIALLVNKYYLLVATDRRWVVMTQSKLSIRPKAIDRSLDRSASVGSLSGLWGRSQILGTTTYVHWRFHKDAEAADAALGQAVGYGFVAPQAPAVPAEPVAPIAATPAGWYPSPEGSGQRYWDGSAWTDHTAP